MVLGCIWEPGVWDPSPKKRGQKTVEKDLDSRKKGGTKGGGGLAPRYLLKKGAQAATGLSGEKASLPA